MTTAAKAAGSTKVAQIESANLYELRRGRSTISYTASNIAGEPVVTFDGRTFTGDEVRREVTELGTQVTVTLEQIIDGDTRLLTLVVPEVRVSLGESAPVSLPVVFHTIKGTIAGPPPGQVQTYDVKTYSGTASFIIS